MSVFPRSGVADDFAKCRAVGGFPSRFRDAPFCYFVTEQGFANSLTIRALDSRGTYMEILAFGRYKRAEAVAAIAAWQHPGAVIDGESTPEDRVTQLADILRVEAQFIARGRDDGTVSHRAWVWIHQTRPDIIKGDSVDSYAKRNGTTVECLHGLIREYRAAVSSSR